MKGLSKLLPPDKAPEIYWRLQRKPDRISPKEFVHWTQYSRYDARLAEQLAEHIRDYWYRYDPVVINSLAQKEAWPGAVGFLIEHTLEQCSKSIGVRTQFQKWAATAQRGLPSFTWGLFFIGAWPIASAAMNAQVSQSLSSYKKWGFYGKDILFNKQIPGEIKAPSYRRNQPKRDEQVQALPIDQHVKVTICKQLREYKIRHKLTNREFAERLGVSQSKSSNIYNYNTKDISVALFLKLAERIACSGDPVLKNLAAKLAALVS